MMIDQRFLDKLKSGDRRILAKSITLIESSKESDQGIAQELLNKILHFSGRSFRLGITGAPGVGKSTFIENFGLLLISKGHKVAVLTVDPSSPISGGSILGDKTRMEKLSVNDKAYIRSSPSNGFLGGVAQKTRESILLCEAAGYDFVIIETVGVGQSEYEVSNMVDFFMLLTLPNAGDEIQGIKKGILELAHLIAITKAENENLTQAKLALSHIQNAMRIIEQKPNWIPSVILISSINNFNLDQIYNQCLKYIKIIGDEGLQLKRKEQNISWFNSLIEILLKTKLHKIKNYENYKNELIKSILNNQLTPLKAATELLANIFPSDKEKSE